MHFKHSQNAQTAQSGMSRAEQTVAERGTPDNRGQRMKKALPGTTRTRPTARALEAPLAHHPLVHPLDRKKTWPGFYPPGTTLPVFIRYPDGARIVGGRA